MSEKYFLGSMTPGGFVTQFGEYVNSDSFYTYVLKGAAGTGKSSLMKKIADRFEESENVTAHRIRIHLTVWCCTVQRRS